MNNPSSNSPLFGRFLSGLFSWKIWLFLQIFQGSKSFYRFLYHYLYRRPKIDRILSSDVIYIPEKKLYSIPLDVLKMERQMVNSDRQKLTSVTTWKVKTIHPTITETEIQFHDITVDLQQVHLIKSDLNNYDYTNTRRLAPLVKTLLFEINPKIASLVEKKNQLHRLRNLAASSEIFHSQAPLYDRAINQVQLIIDQAEALGQECLRFIRETLIERELVQSDIDSNLVDCTLDFASQYQLIQEKYQLWKEEVQAYCELKDSSLPKN
ncbi:MAG: hypothetical protein EWV76_21900 [Microcystis novacekii Mn_MB_F_20050700_S1]|uniref:Uncharacterized protein n=1 Tax=Microcystis novacekii Mn_MB_F_20050700_S1D TaxID=2486266 RepID=A0A552IT02_9CHRO|nr:MAG: hypothetical protein EWV76_21900 [Microcystis novacekii Mn_MB_F_20050700_S1]TRU86577.1 MAG: hypothetical protein EWV54_14065 [Microcystis novacekii Mn_MB_F_20050700_S1D]